MSGLLERLTSVTVWRRGGERAPHKPLLLLMALARVQRGEARLIGYDEVHQQLTRLLRDFGPARKSFKPEYPFWRLQGDGIWEIPQAAKLEVNRAGDVSTGKLRRVGAEGGFPAVVYDELRARPGLVNDAVTALLEQNFPPSIHDDLLDAVGMPWAAKVGGEKKARDPAFRERVLRIYEHRCAICGFDGRLGHADLGIEAAHVKWHAAGGPDSLDNGLALCTFHHKLLDRGALGIGDDLTVLVSQDVHGSTGIDDWLYRWQGERLRAPQPGEPRPASPYVAWHRREVFRPPPRG